MSEIQKKRFEVKMVRGKNGTIKKDVYIDDELLDWSMDVSSFADACKMGPQYKLAVQQDIAKHFTEAVSDTLGRNVTAADIKEAIRTGWI